MTIDKYVVTAYDPETDEMKRIHLSPNGYVLVCGENMEISSYQQYSNGTVQLTVKRKAQP